MMKRFLSVGTAAMGGQLRCVQGAWRGGGSRKWLQARGRGGSIIIDCEESVNQHRCITGTSRCMQGNFSLLPERRRRRRSEGDWCSKQSKQIIKASD